MPVRILMSALLVSLAIPSSALSDPGRYQIAALGDGFVRIDTQTGAMTLCRMDTGTPQCDSVPVAGAPAVESKSDADTDDLDRALSMMDRAMRRFMAMTRDNPRECAL